VAVPSESFITVIRQKRLKKPVKRYLAVFGFFLLLIILLPLIRSLFDSPGEVSTGTTRVHRFRDLNEDHLRYARSYGISPIASKKVFEQKVKVLTSENKLVKINDSKYYSVNKLSHSHPFLVPRAKRMLDLIGERFRKKLQENNLDDYQYRITSLLRTQESQRMLSFANINAASKSAHLYGTTFDITYKSLSKKSLLGAKKTVHDGAAIRLLSEAIRELQQERRLLVITERKEACFHITVR
jgi:energy-coupling factor transporter transmembrane protein EcfT